MKHSLRIFITQPHAIFFLIGAIVILGLDCVLPQEINIAVLYIPLIFTCIRSNSHLFPTAATIFISFLIGIVPFLKPESPAFHFILINKISTLIAVWISYYLVRMIQRSNDRYQAIWRQNSTGLLLVNQKGDIIQVSPAIQQFFGYNDDELLGKKIETLIPHRFQHKHLQHRSQFNANPHPRSMGVGLDLFGRKKDGTEFPVEVSLSPFESEAGHFVIVFVIDNTVRKTQEDTLKAQKKELEALTHALKTSNKELENFAYISSHDLQEPLRKIRAFSDLLDEPESGNLSGEGKSYLERIQQSATRMQRLIRDLLEFSRVSTRALPFERIKLTEILQDVLADIDLAIKDARGRIELGELPELEADPTQMRQLFQNLLSNAIKFRKEDTSPVIRIEAQPSHKGQDWVEIRIQDNGIGFDEKYLDRIFTIFQRLDGNKHEGSGIGLAICLKIAQRHGGEITAQSKVEEGSTFILHLPVTQSTT
jgi:two-component system, LuxR family, sensor kinase FixL